MSDRSLTTRDELNSLAPGDSIQVDREVKVGSQIWRTTTSGVVERIERRRHGLHHRRQHDDKAFSDLVVLKLADGSLTTLTIDEFSNVKKLS